jgi:hypothetical protein
VRVYPRLRRGLGPNGRFRDNRLVPIPLQTIRLNTTAAVSAGVWPIHRWSRRTWEWSQTSSAPHLNATKRVWWETVLVNQTFYVGRAYTTAQARR